MNYNIIMILVNDSNRDQVFSIYESLSKELPKAMCPKRLALYVATGIFFFFKKKKKKK